jgi:uncharacterized membrane protein
MVRVSVESVLSVVTILILVPLCGVVFALTPWLAPKGELFSVSVPTAAASDSRARSLKRSYSLWVLAVTALLTGWVSYVLVAIHPNMAALASCVAMVVLVLFGYFLMLHYRDKAQDLKRARGWKAKARKSAAMLGGVGVPKPVPLGWELLNILPIAASVMVAVLGYDSAPDLIPIHAGMDGVVNGWAEKSVPVMLLPIVFQLAMAGTMTISHAMLLGSKRPIDPRHPASSAFAYGAYVHAWSACCVGMGLALNTSGVLLEASMVGWVSFDVGGTTLTAVALAVLVPCVVLAVRYGQNGTRLLARLPEDFTLPADDDDRWYGGVFYANRKDPAVVVPKRFGIGWTLNLGRPVSWLIMAGLVAICVVAVVATVQG